MKNLLLSCASAVLLCACESDVNEFAPHIAAVKSDTLSGKYGNGFQYVTESFADLRIQRYQVPGFEALDLTTKAQLYYLYEAALAGRDIYYDQNYRHNLVVRKTLEAIVENNTAPHDEDAFPKLLLYAKRVWFSNGIHHHYSNNKILPEFSPDYLRAELGRLPDAALPMQPGQTKAGFIAFITPVIFDPAVAPKKVNLDPAQDLVQSSAVNFYEGVTKPEVEAYYKKLAGSKGRQPSWGLNSKVVKENGRVTEKTWFLGGMYAPAIEKIVYWLEKALSVTTDSAQRASLAALIKYYRSGNLKDFDDYSIAWIKDTSSRTDVVNGFIEVYDDPLAMKGSFESVVSIKDMEASRRIATIGASAQWFEDNAPIMEAHKRKPVKGIAAKVINVVVESGAAGPSSAIGINLPNSEWIREDFGSKSVQLGNIVESHEHASGGAVVEEFFFSDEIRKRVRDYAGYADMLHTDMHEVIGHASGKIEKGVGQSQETLQNYASTLEEGRADLVALYYLMDPKLVELGVMPSLDYGKAAYDDYITTGLIVQLARIEQGKDIEEAHMRNRKYISSWCYEKGKKDKVIEEKTANGKTYYVVNDYNRLRTLFGELLREIQRIKSQGDYAAGKALVETYGVKIDPALHREVLERYARLNIAPYAGFIQPKLVPVFQGDSLMDVKIEYPDDFTRQMLEYGRSHSFLPVTR